MYKLLIGYFLSLSFSSLFLPSFFFLCFSLSLPFLPSPFFPYLFLPSFFPSSVPLPFFLFFFFNTKTLTSSIHFWLIHYISWVQEPRMARGSCIGQHRPKESSPDSSVWYSIICPLPSSPASILSLPTNELIVFYDIMIYKKKYIFDLYPLFLTQSS